MSEAVKQIVEAYVGVNNREGLEEIRAHRQKLRSSLQRKAGGWFDVSRAIRACDEDIDIVEAGLARLGDFDASQSTID